MMRFRTRISVFAFLLILTCAHFLMEILFGERRLHDKPIKDILMERRTTLRAVCNSHNIHGHSYYLLNNTEHGLYYCVVPKVACTFWTRIFRFINNETGGARKPSDISRISTHVDFPKTHKNTFEVLRDQPRDSVRFMFVRNPFTRLWSAYLDKFFLPGFWIQFGKAIVERRKYPSDASCPDDITFEEFVDFVLSEDPVLTNDHWRPITNLCDPCKFDPHIIGKMESFKHDSDFLLTKLGLSDSIEDGESHVEAEIALLTEVHFEKRLLLPDKCLSKVQLSQRLWQAFQINGYIPLATPFPEAENPRLNRVLFAKSALHVYRQNAYRSKDVSLQRKTYFENAFRNLATVKLLQLQHLYYTDFLLFSYNMSQFIS